MGPCKSINDSNKQKSTNADFSNAKSDHSGSSHQFKKQTPASIVYGISKFGVDIQPEQELKEPLKFYFQLSKFKCKMLKEAKFYVLQVIFDNQAMPLAIGSGSNPKFQIDEVIEKNIVYKDLENSYLEIILYTYPSDKSERDIKNNDISTLLQSAALYSSLKVDLLTIAIGPEHHDLVLVEPKKSSVQIGRINYCVSCSHLATISLRIQTVNLQINSLLKNELSLKLKFEDSKNQKDTLYTEGLPSQPNAKEEITSYEYRPLAQIENILNIESKMSMQELRGSDASVNIYSTRLIEYNQQSSSGLIPKRMGSTKVVIPKNKDLTLVTYYSLIGFSTLNFHKILYENDSHILKQTSKFFQSMSNKNQWNQLKYNDSFKERFKFQVFETLNEHFEDEIYRKGTSIGKITMKIEVKNIPLIRQIMCGVMTETGFEINSIFLYDNALLLPNSDNKQYNSLPYELQTLMKQKNQLECEIANRTQLRSVSNNEKDFNCGILKYMNNIKSTLSKSIEEDCLYYGYSNAQDLYQGQAVMLELGLNCLEIIDKLNMDQRTICFDILRLINERSEFDLGTLSLRWFTEIKKSDKPQVVFQDNVLIDKKIIESFIQFNNEALRFSLECIARGKNIDNDSKQFSLFFLSSAYFRIPSYRDAFINSILRESPQFSKSQNHKPNVTSIDDMIDLDPINSLILWDKLFYMKLASSLKSTQLENEIKEQLQEMNDIISSNSTNRRGDWKDQLNKRDFVFFDLIISLDEYLQRKVTKGIDINWLNIPGFDLIIVAINNELKYREVKCYPRPLLEIITMFTNNISVINSFTRIILNRTNVFDTNAVFNAMNFLDLLFNRSESRPNSEQFKSKFDYNCLFIALKVIITTEHSLSLSKCLWLYYRNSHLMSIGHLTEVLNSVFLSNFYSLFFHWSWQVRHVFYYLILFTYGHRLKGKFPSNCFETDHLSNIFRLNSQKFSNGNDMSYGEVFESKMIPIQEIQNIIYIEELNPSFNSKIDLEKFNDALIGIPEKVHSNILVSISHFEKIEIEFGEWKQKATQAQGSNNPIDYPLVNIVPPRDDIVDYAPDY